jgi:hypothetical protein
MFEVRHATVGAVVAAVMSLAGIACASSDDGQSESAFCDSAQTLPDKLVWDQYANGLVQALRELNTSGLADADREELSSAIDLVEEQIAAFNDGQPGGWSTEPWSSVVSRICDVEIWVHSLS